MASFPELLREALSRTTPHYSEKLRDFESNQKAFFVKCNA